MEQSGGNVCMGMQALQMVPSLPGHSANLPQFSSPNPGVWVGERCARAPLMFPNSVKSGRSEFCRGEIGKSLRRLSRGEIAA